MKCNYSVFARLIVGFAGVLIALMIAPSLAFAQQDAYGAVTGAAMGDCTKNVELGVGIVRAGMPWWQLQPNGPGTIDWSYQDSIFDCFVNNGIKIYWSLADAPVWAGGGNDHHHVPNYQAWMDFVHQAITHNYTRYGNSITFGIWNEPEGDFLNGCPSVYVNKGHCWGVLLWEPAAAIRAVYAPGARLGGPEMGTLDDRFDWALTMMSNSLQPQDVITTHWYNFYPGLIGWMDTAISKAGNRETWLTETGYIDGCSESAQANTIDSIASTFDNRSNPHWAKLFIYVVAQNTLCASLVRSDGSNKPAFDVYQTHIP
ncbi:MAG TPA: glycosyl hydrolase [Vicinamibacterales bacterium]|jgi:hypothetical protein|nr:glycosyl hydrolase [Vicinamibacterales bacterium]